MRPSRTTALLLHSLCSTPDEFLLVQSELHRAGHGARALRVPGYSFDGAATSADRQSHQAWVRTVLQQVREEAAAGRRVVLVGLSAGAALALGATLASPGLVAGLVLMSTTLNFDGWAVPGYGCLVALPLYTPLGRFWSYRERPPFGVKNPRVRDWVQDQLRKRREACAGAAVISVAHLREFDRLRRLVRRQLSAFACPPVLALHAQEDDVASPDNVRLLRERLRTSSFRSVLLHDSHHMITIDNDRLQVARETVDFVDALAFKTSATTTPQQGARP